MASACVTNNLGFLPENFDWFNPRSTTSSSSSSSPLPSPIKLSENLLDLDFSAGEDFEFRVDSPVNILTADELFLNGKIMPLHISTTRTNSIEETPVTTRSASVDEILKSKANSSVSGMDPYMFSPKAPRCASGWRELLGLKKLHNNSTSCATNSLKRNPKCDPSLAVPLLIRETVNDCEQSRYSTDSSKLKGKGNHTAPPPKVRLVRKASDSNANAMGVSIDSPRMNSSGKVVFQSLERSSSSPSSFNGGPTVKYKGMERRSYSANVKVSPVLNVPVCSLRGLGQLFPSPHKKPGGGTDSLERSRCQSQIINKHKATTS